MRHRHGKCAVVSVSNFRNLRGGKRFHGVDDRKGIDNARQVQSDGAQRDRQSDGEHSLKNGTLGADRLSDDCDGSAVLFRIAIMKKFRNEKKEHTRSDADGDAGDRVSGGDLNAFAFVDGIVRKNDTDYEFADRFRNFTDRGRHHISMPLKIASHGAG